MIELIFAIVIISLAVLSLPMMNRVISNNIESNIVQEAIFAASAELNQIISFAWDENSMETNATLSRVVWTSATDCITNKQRPGHVMQPYHRRCADANATRPTTAVNFGPEAGDLDDLDDINTSATPVFTLDLTSSTGYKTDYNSAFSLAYVNFDPTYIANNNIKRIRVEIRDIGTGDVITALSTFSSNIGEIDYYKRSY